MSPAFRDAVQLRLRPDDDAPTHDGWRRKRHLVERVLPQHLELGAGLDDERVAVLAEHENLAVVRPRGRREAARVRGDALAAVDLLAGPRIVTRKETPVEQGIEVIAVHEWRG